MATPLVHFPLVHIPVLAPVTGARFTLTEYEHLVISVLVPLSSTLLLPQR